MLKMNLLIVDDMPIIADGLYELFREEQRIPMEVHKAYSAPAALQILREKPIDIVVTDIKMPEITGLELLKEINRLWPHCKVIFLTSYHDFDFAREAIILGGFDFILKTEGDARILEAVHKAAQALSEERDIRQLILKAQEQYRLALPSLQKDYLVELLQGKHRHAEARSEQFRKLEIALRPELPVYLVVARIDRWKQSMTWSDQALLLYSAGNIMDEYLGSRVRMTTVNMSPMHIVGIWQPITAQTEPKEAGKVFRFFYGTLETIQNTCRDLLKLHISFVLSASPVSWEAAGEKLQELELLTQSGIGLNEELLTTDEELQGSNQPAQPALQSAPLEPGLMLRFVQYSSMPALLAAGRKDDFLELFDDLVDTVNGSADHLGLKLETLHYLAYLFLGYMNRRQLLAPIAEKLDIGPLMSIERNPDWARYARFYRELTLLLFDYTSEEQESRSNRLVQEIEQFVQGHLDQDLSLTRLGDHVHLNPTYLSRLYKQITGNGISDYIMEARIEKAKHLLAHSDRKIHEIAEDTGYQSGIAFTRFFKKMMNVTPQEYREAQEKLRGRS